MSKKISTTNHTKKKKIIFRKKLKFLFQIILPYYPLNKVEDILKVIGLNYLYFFFLTL